MILFSNIEDIANENKFKEFLQYLPDHSQEKCLSYQIQEDQKRFLIGRLLIRKGFSRLGSSVDPLNSMKKNRFGKPFIQNSNYFNISHSGKMVIAAFSKVSEIGIDIEEIKEIDINDFRVCFVEEEWKKIDNAKNRVEAFYSFWVKKEALLKASGRGLTIPLKSFSVLSNRVQLFDNTYILKEVFDKSLSNYRCCLSARNIDPSNLSLERIRF